MPAGWGYWLVALTVVLVDLVDLLARAMFRRLQTRRQQPGRVAPTSVPLAPRLDAASSAPPALEPYALLVSVHNLGDGADRFVAAMRAHQAHLWVIDDASTDDTADRLARAGVRCLRGTANRHKPAAIRQLLTTLPPEITTVFVLDPDGLIMATGDPVEHLERTLRDFQQSGMAACSPRVAVRPRGWLERLQAFEYCLSFSLGRKSLADRSITSGFAVYRRDALARVLDQHTLSVYAEDLENTMLLTRDGERIYYDGRLVIETDGKTDWRSLFSQRVGWHFGLLRVYTQHWRDVLRWVASGRPVIVYQHVAYVALLCLLLHPVKGLCLALMLASGVNGVDNVLALALIPDVDATDPLRLPVAWLAYSAVMVGALRLGVGRAERRRLAPTVPLYFFYSLALIVPVTVGYLNWVTVRVFGRRLYRDYFGSDASLERARLDACERT